MRLIQSSRQNKGIHFEKAVILEIVRQRENGASTRMLCQEFKMSGATLAMWMIKYGSSNYKSGLRVMHKPQQIRPIVRAILEGRLTFQEAAIKNKVSIRTIKDWIKRYQQEDADLPIPKQDDMPPPAQSVANRALHEELEAARLKIKALETMIEVAEEQFKIPIRKKFGAKQ